jgi:hypothetical protein
MTLFRRRVRLRSMQCLDSVTGVSHVTFLIICTFDKIRAPKVLILCLLLARLMQFTRLGRGLKR